MAEKQINYRKSSIPSGPSATQITIDGLKSKKGGAEFVSEMPKAHMVPDGAKGEKEVCSNPKGPKSMDKPY